MDSRIDRYSDIILFLDGQKMSQSIPVKRPRLLVLFFLYFFQYAAQAITLTFMNVYYMGKGLSGTQIGTINMVGGLVGFMLASFWGYLSDKTGKTRWLLVIGAAGMALSILAVPLFNSFIAYLLLACIYSAFFIGVMTLTDGAVVVLLGDRRTEYGRYRMGGSIGFIIVSASAGYLFQVIDLRAMFPIFAILMFLYLLIALRLPNLPIHRSENALRALGTMIRKPNWLFFAAAVFLAWLSLIGMVNYLPNTMTKMGAQEGLIGLAPAVGALSEIPFLMLSGYFIRRWGTARVIWLSLILFVVRQILLGLMIDPAMAVPISLLNGPTFAVMWPAAINFSAEISPPHLKATSQGLLTSITSLSGLTAAMIGGWLFDNTGGNQVYFYLAGFAFLGWLLFSLRKVVSSRPEPA